MRHPRARVWLDVLRALGLGLSAGVLSFFIALPVHEWLMSRLGYTGCCLANSLLVALFIALFTSLAAGLRRARARAESERDSGEAQLRALLDNLGDAAVIHRPGGACLEVNRAACETLGYSREELLRMGIPGLVDTSGWDMPQMTAQMLREGRLQAETTWRTREGAALPIEVLTTPITYRGESVLLSVARDLTERNRAEAYGEMGREVLQILNEPGDLQGSIQRVLAALKTRTGFDAVGIRLQDGEDFPYFAQEGFSREFLLTEDTLIGQAAEGGVCRGKDGNVSLECTCGLVLSGQTDPASPLFTPGGSFWTNDSFPLLALPPSEDPRLNPRNQCIYQGYASMALVPIRDQDRIVGLIQLNDRRQGRFTLDTVELLEGIASHLGAALRRRQAEEELRRALARSEGILATSMDGFFVLGTDGRLQDCNPAYCDLLGYTREELLSLSLTDLEADESPEQTAAHVEAVAAQGYDRFETMQRRQDGSLVPLEISTTFMPTEEGGQFVCFARDITKRRADEAALRANLEFLNTLFDTI